MRQDCIHFYDKMARDRTASIFMTSWHETGTPPFYIAMYIHIYVHIYTSQKECLCIFAQGGCIAPMNGLLWGCFTLKYVELHAGSAVSEFF